MVNKNREAPEIAACTAVPKFLDVSGTVAFLKRSGLEFNERQVKRMFDEKTIVTTKIRGRRYTTESFLRAMVAKWATDINGGEGKP